MLNVYVHVHVIIVVVMLLFVCRLYVNVFISCYFHVTILNVCATYAYLCLLCKYLYYGVTLISNCYLLIFLFLEITENNKKKKFDTSSIHCPILYFGMNKAIFSYLCFYTCMCWISCLEYVWYEFGIVNGSRLLFYDLPKRDTRENFGSILNFPRIPN